MSMPLPVPTTLPSFICTDARVPDPDSVNFGSIERDLLRIDEEIRLLRDTIPSTRPPESNHSHTQRDYEDSTNSIRTLAEGASTRQLFSETSEHRWTPDDAVNSNSLDVAWTLDIIRKADEECTSPPNASQDNEGIFSTGPRQLAISGQSFDGRSEDRYGGAGAAHESAEPDGSKGSAEAGEGDTRLRQSRSSVSLIRPLPSKSHISNTLIRQQHTSTSQLVDDSVYEERDDSHTHTPRRVPRSSSPSSQAPALLSIPIPPEHSGIFNGSGSPGSSAGVHHAGLLVPDQCRGSSLAHRDTEHPPVQNHYLIASSIPRRHINPSPSLGTLHSPPSFDDFKDDMLPLEKNARQSSAEAECLDVGTRHTEAPAKIREAAVQKVAEAKHNEVEAKKREVETRRKLEEATQQELEARQKEKVVNRNEEAARKQEAETRRKEEVASRWEEDARRRLVDARQQEIFARQREEEARRSEERVRKEEEDRRKEDVARRRREEDELTKAWGRAPPAQGKVTRLTPQALGSSRHEPKELEAACEADDTARREAAKADAANRPAEVKSTAPRYRNQPNVQAQGQRTWQRDAAVEERCQKQLEDSEQQRLKEQRHVYLEEKIQRCEEEKRRRERERDEQIRNEELRREEKVKEINRLRKDEDERLRILTEQRRKVVEQNSQRDQPRQQQLHQKDIPRSRTQDEQKEYGREVHRRPKERKSRNNIGAAFGTSVPHPPASPMSARARDRNGVVSKPNSSLPNSRQRVPERYANASKFAGEDSEWVEVEGIGVDPNGRKNSVEEEERAQPAQERARHRRNSSSRSARATKSKHSKNAKVVPKKPEKRSTVGGIISRVLPSTGRSSQKR